VSLQSTGVARNFDWGGGGVLGRYFGVVFQLRNDDDVTKMTS